MTDEPSAEAQSPAEGAQPGAKVRSNTASNPYCCPWQRSVWAAFKGLVAMLLGQTPVGSVFLLGWTHRLMQRVTLMRWRQLSRSASRGDTFADFAAGGVHSQEHIFWPNWVLGQNGWPKAVLAAETSVWSRLRRVVDHLTRSFRRNLKIGLQGLFCTWVLTLPGCVFWLFSWYDGWNNSFNKGYEQAAVGPLVFILGMALFIAAMFYVPMAQARFASTGQWRSFFEFRNVWRLVRLEWVGCLLLAGVYAAFSFPLTIYKTMPQFFPQMQPAFELLSPDEAIEFLKTYFFWGMLLFLPAFLLLRSAASYIYASGIVRGLRRGNLNEDMLAENEWETLHRLDLLEAPEPRQHHLVIKLFAWVATRAGRLTAGVLIGVFWFLFVAQILVGEFFTYHPFIGWMNQPLIQLPWFRYLPAGSPDMGS